jgi:hypothetical protein
MKTLPDILGKRKPSKSLKVWKMTLNAEVGFHGNPEFYIISTTIRQDKSRKKELEEVVKCR